MIRIVEIIDAILVFVFDGRGPSTSPSTSPTNRRSGSITRAMTKKIQEDWNTATDGRETSQYMFKDAITLV